MIRKTSKDKEKICFEEQGFGPFMHQCSNWQVEGPIGGLPLNFKGVCLPLLQIFGIKTLGENDIVTTPTQL